VPSQVEAEVACGLLRSEGILCDYRRASFISTLHWPLVGDWQEILVAERDLVRAREIIAAIQADDDV
jgi:hypothetical protein